MRYSADHKLKARRSIIELGAKQLKTGGFEGAGVDQIAAAAGVTSGALYSNFSGKEELLKEVISTYLGAPFIDADESGEIDWRARFEEFLTGYISPMHRGDAAEGCVMPALSADVSRASASVRRAYQRKVTELIEKIAKAVKGGSSRHKRGRAWSILALMVGSMTVARALPDGDEANEMLDAALRSALQALEA